MRIIVTGGGTGGHIFPAIAVHESLRKADPSGDVLFVGGTSGMECTIVPQAGIPYKAVTARKMPAKPSLATLKGVAALMLGYIEARKCILSFGADAVVGAGGYVAAATVLAASHMGLPTLILECNLVPGRTNLQLSKKAAKICVSFEETISHFPGGRCELTGMPLRAGTVAATGLSKIGAASQFAGLRPDCFTLVVIGGSQGARAINSLIVSAAPTLLKNDVQILHQTGTSNFDYVVAEMERQGIMNCAGGYVARTFLSADEIPLALRSADLLACRGGISTLSEAAVNGVPMLVIPLPTAYADHQTANARALETLGAAICRPEAGLTGAAFAEEVMGLRNERDRLVNMASRSLAFGRPKASEHVAGLALKLSSRS